MSIANLSATGSTGAIGSGASNTQSLMVEGTAGAAHGAYLAFHRPGAFAAYLGLDTDNQLKLGGWSYGTNAYKILHEGMNPLNLQTVNVATLNASSSINSAGGIVATNISVVTALPTGDGNFCCYSSAGVEQGRFLWHRATGRMMMWHTTGRNLSIDNQGYVQVGRGFHGRQGVSGADYHAVIMNTWHDITGGIHQYVNDHDCGIFITTSDYRLKKDIRQLPSMWDTIKQLRPISYSQRGYKELFVDDDKERWGFVAHELQETLVETAANGKKDENNVIQSVNLAPVVAALTKALQEAMARIEALEAQVK